MLPSLARPNASAAIDERELTDLFQQGEGYVLLYNEWQQQSNRILFASLDGPEAVSAVHIKSVRAEDSAVKRGVWPALFFAQ